MRKIICILSICLVLLGCRKTSSIEETKPILVKVEAIHTTGQIVTSEIILVK